MTPASENYSGAGVFVVGTEGSDPSVPQHIMLFSYDITPYSFHNII